MSINHDINSIELTSSEIGYLWTAYIADSMSKQVISYFSNKIQDKDIDSVVKYALGLSGEHLLKIESIFNTINYPIPYGFTDKDININAKKLFSEPFILLYIKYLSKFALVRYSMGRSISSRADVRDFFNSCIDETQELHNRADNVLLEKGLYVRPPHVPIPDKVEFVQKKSYLAGFIGDLRPINTLEIAHAFSNLQTNVLGKTLITGFSQVVKSEKIKEYMIRGGKLAEKHIKTFSKLLEQDNLPSPMTWAAEVTDSTESPFSDKLMLFHVTTLIGFSMGIYGLAVANSMRKDIVLTYGNLISEIAQYSKDGIDIMIENGWLEKTPEAADRKELIGV